MTAISRNTVWLFAYSLYPLRMHRFKHKLQEKYVRNFRHISDLDQFFVHLVSVISIFAHNKHMTHSILLRSSLTYLRRHPLQLAFSLLGISLGVAIAVAMDLAIFSAKKSFQISIDALSGKATHTLRGDNPAVPEAIYRRLRVDLGLRDISPLIRGDVVLTEQSQRVVPLIGLDPFSGIAMHGFSEKNFTDLDSDMFQRLLVLPHSVLVSDIFLHERGLKIDDQLWIEREGEKTALTIVGSYVLKTELAAELKNWLVADMSTAQELLQMQGYVSQIDLVVNEDNQDLLVRIKAILPSGVELIESDEGRKAMARLSESFELNLSALSLLGLLVAMFLIYNTTMFSVVQRRDIFARMRVMGVSRQELFQMILYEALLIAIVATLVGMGLGVILAKSLLGFISQTINDLYYRVQVNQLYWGEISFIKAILLGIGATLSAACFPAWEAAMTRPVKVLQRYELEQKTLRWIKRLLIPGILGCGVVWILVFEPQGKVWTGFVAVFLLIVSVALILPWIIHKLLTGLSLLMKSFFSLTGKMAVNNISRSLSRSVIAIIALAIAVSATLGIGIMIKSFRLTVDEWLAGYLRADYFIAPVNRQYGSALIEPSLKQQIEAINGVQAVSFDRRRQFFIQGENHQLIVLDIPRTSFKAFRLKEGDYQDALGQWFEQDTVIVSEPYAYRHGLGVGDNLYLPVEKFRDSEISTLQSDNTVVEQRAFKIVGVFYHYGAEQGMINMSRAVYDRYWQDAQINSMGVYLADEVDRQVFEQQLDLVLAGKQMRYLSKKYLHQESLKVFDRTFSVTQVLKLLVVLVSFVGILSALMAIALERRREFAVLRALGLTPSQLKQLVYLETLTIGVIAALLAMPLGTLLAYLLIDVINYRSFGWSMLFSLPWQEYLYALLLALLASLGAAIYPAHYMAKSQPALSLRGE